MRKVMSAVMMSLLASTVWAHAKLVSSDPANGAELTAAPKKLTLVFSDHAQVTAVTVTGKSGKPVAVKAPIEVSKQFSLPLPALEPGKYLVEWRAAGHDGHAVTGKIAFSVVAP
jgi:methionine-rich copper-binding protein CopC